MNKHTFQSRLTAATLMLALTLMLTLVGCGDTEQMQLERGRIAIANAKPAAALEAIAPILEKNPKHRESRLIKAEAQMQQFRVDAARNSVHTLLEDLPDDPAVRELASNLTFLRLRAAQRQTDFLTNPELQQEVSEAEAFGQAQADWLMAQDRVADAEYLRARLANQRADRLRAMLIQLREQMAILQEKGESLSDAQARQVEMLPQQVIDEYRDALDHLQLAVKTEPTLEGAGEMYTRLVVAFQNWDQLAAYAEALAKAEKVDPALAESVAVSVLRVPDAVMAATVKRDLAWSVLDSVAEDRRNSESWMLTASRLHMAANRHDEAQPLLRRVLSKRAKHEQARYLLAQSLYNTENYEEARRILDVLATDMRNASAVQTLHGLVLSKLDEPIFAKEAFRRATELDPNDRRAREGFLMLMAQQGHLNEAAGDVEDFYRLNPDHPEHIRFKMQYHIARGDRTEVRRLLDKVSEQDDLTADHYRVIARGFAYLEDQAAYTNAANKLLELDPEDRDSQLVLASAMLSSDKPAEARAVIDELKKKHADLGPTDRVIASLYLQGGSYSQAIRQLESYIETNRNDTQARLMLAEAMVNVGLSQEALRQVADVLNDQPANQNAHALAARVYLFLGQPQRAREHLRQIDAEGLDAVQDAALLAQVALAAGEPQRALDVCNRAIAAGNADPAIRMVLAATYRTSGNLEEAEQTLLAMVRSQPNTAAAYSRLARFYAENDMVDKGLIELRSLQAYNDTLAILAQSSLLTREQRFDEARQRLEPLYERHRGLRDPVALTIADGLANIELSAGDADEAIAVFEPMFTIGVLEFPARLRQIDLLLNQQRLDMADVQLDSLTRKLTDRLDARQVYEIANRYNRANQQAKAAAVIERKLAQAPQDAWVLLLWRGELEMADERHEDAIATFEQALEVRPDEQSILRRLAQAHEFSFDYVGAEQVYLRMIEIGDAGRAFGLSSLAQSYAKLGLNDAAREVFDQMNSAGVFLTPETHFTMGRVMFVLEEYDLARERFLAVPPRHEQFVAAQCWLALIECNQDQTDQAQRRIRSIAGHSVAGRMLAQEILRLGLRRDGVLQVFGWADNVLDTTTLPATLRTSWLRNRLVVAGRDRNWPLVLRSLEELSEIDSEVLAVDALRVALMARMDRRDAAQALLSERPALSSSPVGGLLAVAVGETPSINPQDGLRAYITAFATNDTDAMNKSVDYMRPYRTIFVSDLREKAGQSVEQRQAVAQHLATSLLALGAGMPTLCFNAAEDALAIDPDNVLALSLKAAGLIDDLQDLGPLREQVAKQAPDSTLNLFLTGQAASRQGPVTPEQGVAAYQAVLQREPDNIHARYLLSQQIAVTGDIDASLAILEKLRETSGPYKLLAQNDAAYLMAIHKPDQLARAKSLAREAIQLAPDNIALVDTLGWIEHLAGDHESAIARINRSLVGGLSGVAEVQYHAAEIYKALGNDTWARRHYKAAADGNDAANGVKESRQALEKMAAGG